jgi:hypothetical protein
MGTSIGSNRIERHDPALWVELRLGDELAELRRFVAQGDDVRAAGRRTAIDDLLDRRHRARPCRHCVIERLDAGMRAAGIEPTP